MTVASLLTQLAGKRVLVLERHFQLGGFTHGFRRKGYHWDVGLHYVGRLRPGSLSSRLFDLVVGGRVRWQAMPSPFEVFEYPGYRFEVPTDRGAYLDALIRAFPGEEASLRDYFRKVDRVNRWFFRECARKVAPAPIAWWLGVLGGRDRDVALSTTAERLEALFRDERLRSLVASQWGTFGLPPSSSAFAIHALIVWHYLCGGWYPVGGAPAIPTAIGKVLESTGGAMRTYHRVREILVEKGRAVGVRVRVGPEKRSEDVEIRAPVVVSDVGARATLLELLPEPPDDRVVRSLAALPNGPSCVTLYLGLHASAERLGFRGENHWIYEDWDHDALTGAGQLLDGRATMAYLSFPSLKDPLAKQPTAEIISFLDVDGFAPWRGSEWKRRGDEYEALKERIAQALLDLVERHHPGFRDLVAYHELSTPLTVESMTGHRGGQIYGLPWTVDRFRDAWPGPRTPIENLCLTGADIAAHGIVGSLAGGILTTAHLLGPLGIFRILGAARGRSEAHASSV
jgi:phytoene dehydrogenase-like protein